MRTAKTRVRFNPHNQSYVNEDRGISGHGTFKIFGVSKQVVPRLRQRSGGGAFITIDILDGYYSC